MDKKDLWIKIAALAAGGIITGAIIYKLLQVKGESAVPQDPLTDFIDQRASQELKRKEGLAYIEQYIKENITNKIKLDGGLLSRGDFNHVQKVMEIYAKCLLYDTKIKH